MQVLEVCTNQDERKQAAKKTAFWKPTAQGKLTGNAAPSETNLMCHRNFQWHGFMSHCWKGYIENCMNQPAVSQSQDAGTLLLSAGSQFEESTQQLESASNENLVTIRLNKGRVLVAFYVSMGILDSTTRSSPSPLSFLLCYVWVGIVLVFF